MNLFFHLSQLEFIPEETSECELFFLVATVLRFLHLSFFTFFFVLNVHWSMFVAVIGIQKFTSFTTASLCWSFMWLKSNLFGIRYYHFEENGFMLYQITRFSTYIILKDIIWQLENEPELKPGVTFWIGTRHLPAAAPGKTSLWQSS